MQLDQQLQLQSCASNIPAMFSNHLKQICILAFILHAQIVRFMFCLNRVLVTAPLASTSAATAEKHIVCVVERSSILYYLKSHPNLIPKLQDHIKKVWLREIQSGNH